VTTRGLSWREYVGAFLGLFIIHTPLIAAIVVPGLFFVTLSNMMSSISTMYSDSQKFISEFSNKNVLLERCDDVCKVNLLFTHNITSQNITVFSLQQKIANITIVNPQNILVFVELKSNGREEWIYTFYDARITVLFTANLSVGVYPAFPFSDASPRKFVFKENGTRMVYVSLKAGNILNQIFSIFIALVGVLATIRIIKHIITTPVNDVMSKNTHPFAPLIAFVYLNFSSLVVLLSTAILIYELWNPGIAFPLLFILLPLLLSISVLKTGRSWPGLAIFLFAIFLIFCGGKLPVELCFLFKQDLIKILLKFLSISPLFFIPHLVFDIIGYTSCIFHEVIPEMWQLFFSLKLNSSTVLLILLFYMLYPFFYVLGKSAAFAFSTDKTFKLYLMYIYDFTILLWVVQWFFNPYPAMLAWEHKFLGTVVLPLIFGSILVVSLIIIIFSIYMVSIFITRARDISLWLLNLPGLLQFSSLTARYIRGLAWLLPAVPFVLNRELVARGELCASAERGVVKVRIYPEEGDPVGGVVVGCTIDKIAVDNGCERRVFSWGDVWQIELVG